MQESWQSVLDFWFRERDHPEYGKPRQEWFVKNPVFDQQVPLYLGDRHHQAKAGQLDAWQKNPFGCLALIILLDQVPRNLFRHSPQAFATDDQALNLAKAAIAQQFDQPLLPVQRWFMYLPFEHSENLEDQRQSLELFSRLKDDPDSASTIEYAQKHYDVIATFGRFPHRNKILGRASTPAEIHFLKQPGSTF